MSCHRYIFCLVYCLCAFGRLYAQTTNDNQIISSANQLISSNQCDAAIIKLEGVSEEGKRTLPFYLGMAKAHDCKNHVEDALYYYKKYLAFGGNDSVKSRVDILSKQHQEEHKAESEQQHAKDLYSSMTGHKKKRGKTATIDGYFRSYNLVGMIMTASKDKPYTSGLKYSLDFGFPVYHNKAAIIINVQPAAYFSPQKKWYAGIAGVPEETVSGLKKGYGLDVSATVPYLFINTKKKAVGVGPVLGYRVAFIADYLAVDIDMPVAHAPVVGLEAVYYTSKFSIALDYNYFQYSTKALVTGLPAFKANMSMIGIKIGVMRWR